MSDTPVAVITGASSGIGKEIAIALAREGWRIIGTGRNPERIEAAKAAIVSASSGGQVDMLQADLSLLADAKRLAVKIMELTGRLDVLVNNAGGMTDKLRMTSEGLEENYAANHLGPFVLTRELLPLLRQTAADSPSGQVRVLFTSSDASEMFPAINFDDLQNLDKYNPGATYCAGKLANVLMAKELAERERKTGIVCHSVHPGPVDTNFFSCVPEETKEYIMNLDKITGEQGADTLVWLATSDEGASRSGSYWYQRTVREPNAMVEDSNLRKRFWSETEKLVASAGQ